MTAESRLPSMRDAMGSWPNGARQETVNLVGGMQTLAPPKAKASNGQLKHFHNENFVTPFSTLATNKGSLPTHSTTPDRLR